MLLSITEHDDPDGARRLTLTGELDISSTPKLRERLRELGAAHRIIRLDLSRLEFLDCSGIQAMILGLNESARDGWKLELDPNVSPQPARLIEVTGLGPKLWAPSLHQRHLKLVAAANIDQHRPDLPTSLRRSTSDARSTRVARPASSPGGTSAGRPDAPKARQAG